MQTFLPSPSFTICAQVLDNQRLGKQLVEACQIITALEDSSYVWNRHPVVSMWRGHYAVLVLYGVTMYREWQRRYIDKERGGKLKHKSGEELLSRYNDLVPSLDTLERPWWLGKAKLHSSHRGCLLAKNLGHYSGFGWKERPTPPVNNKWPYWWPKA